VESILSVINQDEFQKIKSLSKVVTFPSGERLFSEGDASDLIYFIDSGRVSIFIDKFNSKEELEVMGPGSCFGEMAVFDNDRRTASAMTLEETQFSVLTKADFLALMVQDSNISHKIRSLLNKRNEELVLKEKMIAATGRHMHIGIKGDPSLRESAMTRERHVSVVDKILPQLVPRLEDMLLNRCVYRLYLGFNNGEVRVSTILDPFSEEFHPAVRLVDEAYVERHFPKIDYDRKVGIMRKVYESFRGDGYFDTLPPHLKKGFAKYFDSWQPVTREEIARIMSRLSQLREIPSFYVRNITISIVKDTIHMQFNCDGAHIVSSSGYYNFLDDYL
jgi:CRP-like cAMP-binding protein